MQSMAMLLKPRTPGHRKYKAVLSLLVLLTMLTITLCAQPTQGGVPGRHILAPLWIDDLDGFQIRPPMNCDVLQRKLQPPPPHSAGIFPVQPGDLVTFVNNALRWGIIIHLSELQKDVSLKTLLDQTVAEAQHNYQNVQVLERRIGTNTGRPAGILVLHFTTMSNTKPVPLMRQQLIVRAAPKLYYLLTFFSPGDQANGARYCFSAMIKTFRILNIAKIEQQRAAAISAGRKWIQHITAEQLLKKDIHPQLYQVQVHGHGIGYVLLSCYAGTQDGYKGVFCTTNARSFLPKGEVVFSKVVCFQAFAQQGANPGPATDYTTWDKAVQTLIPINNPQLVKLRQERIVINPKTNKPVLEHIHIPYPNMEIHWVRETGDEQSAYVPALNKHGRPTALFVRHRWMTVYTQRRHVLAGQPNKPVHFNLPSYMPAYLPLTLKYFWPRFVNLSQPAALAFVTYNSGARRLGLRILRVRRKHFMVINGKSTAVYHLTAQLAPGIANLWVNAHGQLLKYEGTDGGIWTPTTYAAMDRKWKTRLAALKQ